MNIGYFFVFQTQCYAVALLLSFDDFKNLNPDIREYLKDNFSTMIKNPQFLESISANIEFAQPAPGRVQRIIEFMQTFSENE
jgi:hypothetical protein